MPRKAQNQTKPNLELPKFPHPIKSEAAGEDKNKDAHGWTSQGGINYIVTWFWPFFFFFFFFFFLRPFFVLLLCAPLGVLFQPVAAATRHLTDRHHSSQQRRILNPPSDARGGTHILTDTSRFCNLLNHNRDSSINNSLTNERHWTLVIFHFSL